MLIHTLNSGVTALLLEAPCVACDLPLADSISLARHPQDLVDPRRRCWALATFDVPQSQMQLQMEGPSVSMRDIATSRPNLCPEMSLRPPLLGRTEVSAIVCPYSRWLAAGPVVRHQSAAPFSGASIYPDIIADTMGYAP
jgi:hypothetical protein